MKGSGSPVTGMRRWVMPTLTNTWKTTMAAIPTPSRYPKRSRAAAAVISSRHTIRAKRASTAAEPTNPSCSATAVKMKSVRCAGTKAPLVCVPWDRPRPNSPPLAMAIWLCAWL